MFEETNFRFLAVQYVVVSRAQVHMLERTISL